jgi:integrase
MPDSKLTDKLVKGLPAPDRGNRIFYDSDVKGFGCRVTAAGARAFILNYRTNAGRERRYTIGSFPDWRTTAAREEVKRLKLEIRVNAADPVGGLEAARGEPTVADMITRYVEEHLPKKRPGSQAEDRGIIKQWLTNGLHHTKVAAVTFADVDALHRKITRAGTPYRANRTVALLSKMFSLAVRWGWRLDNPCRTVEKNPEAKRTRYLTGAELERLTTALAAHPDQQAANIVRLLLFTGARRGETLAAKWSDFDLEAGVWTKPGATTKQATEHRVPLSAPARQLLAGMDRAGEYLFPGAGGGHRVDLKRPWPAICKAANLAGVRIHDLRHTYASVLASSGQSLHIIGALLGHTQAATTHRYAHLLDDPLRAATETAGAVITGEKSADIKRLRRGSVH